MLKRFMNWLLYRLQRVLGAISGQRKGNRSGTASQINFSSEGYKSQDGQLQEGSSDSATYSQSTGMSASGDSEPSPFIEASQEPQALNNLTAVNPAIAEPDTHRRLNASSAALPGVETAVPSFPTDVSELVPSSLPSTNLPASDEQLPEIHDLLPAAETDSQAIDDLSDAICNDKAASVNTLSSEVPNDNVNVVSSGPKTLLTEPTVEPAPPNEEIPEFNTASNLPASNVNELPPQAVLFSFDIIESDSLVENSATSVLNNESVSDQENVWISPTSEDLEVAISIEPSVDSVRLEENSETSLPSDIEDISIESSVIETDELIADNDVLDVAAAEYDEVEDSGVSLEDDQPLEALPDVATSELNQHEVDVNDVSSSSHDIESLPYPWSLAVPKQASNPTTDIADKTDAALTPRSVNRQDHESIAPDHDNIAASSSSVGSSPVMETSEVISKNGVVKLLFTLKPGNFHGYIVPNDGTQDILFHQKYINSDVFDCLERGDQVVVSVKHIEGKAYATNVDLL